MAATVLIETGFPKDSVELHLRYAEQIIRSLIPIKSNKSDSLLAHFSLHKFPLPIYVRETEQLDDTDTSCARLTSMKSSIWYC